MNREHNTCKFCNDNACTHCKCYKCEQLFCTAINTKDCLFAVPRTSEMLKVREETSATIETLPHKRYRDMVLDLTEISDPISEIRSGNVNMYQGIHLVRKEEK
jgi:hypothetical protein